MAGTLRKRKSQGVQSAAVGLSILKTLIESDRPLFLREVAANVGMASSNVYRYLVTFVDAGMITQDAGTGQYDLGPLAIQLGLSALRRIDAVDIAIDCLSSLVTAAKADGHLCVWGSSGPTVLRWKVGPADIAVRVAEGLVLPVVSSATGRTWAAFLDEDVYRSRLNREVATLTQGTKKTKAEIVSHFQAELEEIRRTGLSFSSGEHRAGIDALCAPVFGREGQIVLTMTLLGISAKFDAKPEGTPAASLRLAVEEISRRLGGGELVRARYPWNTAPAAGHRR